MSTWPEFVAQAPTIATVFTRRHSATGDLCLLATLRFDGSPRISPMEPRIFDDQLWLSGMPHTTKFNDLQRDPRFCLHTATVDPQVTDGDAKLWGVALEASNDLLRRRFATDLFEESGFDLRGQEFALFGIDITGGSAVQISDRHLDITVWTPGQPERVVRKH
ncbi:MAG: hypothetical protein QOJ80_1061 [Mycobacterium sp.]|nr:hypothetical protein [Mycobacterium sp.]